MYTYIYIYIYAHTLCMYLFICMLPAARQVKRENHGVAMAAATEGRLVPHGIRYSRMAADG